MIGGLLATLAGSAWARTALRYGVTALAILLFLLALRRSGERAGGLTAVATALVVTAALIGALLLWRRLFQLGPFEWFLRRITYARLVT